MASDAKGPSRVRGIIDLAASVAMLVAAGVVIWTALHQPVVTTTRPPIPIPKEPIALGSAPTLGDPNAPVVVLEFSDLECPYCGRFSTEILPDLKKAHLDSGQVQLVFRHLPLTAIHPRAERAAEAAACAAKQGKFWALHDRLFSDQKKLEDADLEAGAAASGVDLAAFRLCMATEAASLVKGDAELAKALQLSGTPVFLIGSLQLDGGNKSVRVTEIISGARPVEDFRKAIERIRPSGP
jgi:protein-disulfide isomerase